MLELKRILWNRRSFLLFGLLLFLHGVFFFFQCNEAKSNTLTGEALEEYIDGYADYVNSVHENVAVMRENPLFNNEESFVYRNLIKTGDDYAGLTGITPVIGENRGIVTLLNFNLTSFVLLLVGIYIVLCFMAERQKGLYLLIRCTYKGRMQLSLQRIGILGVGILTAALLLFGSTLLMSMRLFPGCDMGRPIQSVPEFGSVTGHYSIGGFLLLFFLKKAIGCLLTCLLLYFCMSIFRSSLCIIIFFLLFAGEYGLYALIIPTGKWSAFKYLNLYTYVFCGTEYAHYYNLNVFGHPLNIAAGADVLAFIGTVVMILFCLIRYAVQYPKSEYKSLWFVEKIRTFVSRHKPSYPLFLWELKKVLFSQKALFIFVILFYLAFSASTEANYLDFRSRYITHWYEELAGKIDEEKITEIRDKKIELEIKIEKLEISIQRLEENLIRNIMTGKGTDYISGLISERRELMEEYKKELKGISVVLEQAEAGLEFYLKTGIAPELIDPTAYELLLYNDKRTILRNYLYTLLTVVLMLSGIMAFEKASNMEMLLNSLYKGRKQTLFGKILIMLGICTICTLSIHLIQYVQIGKVFEYVHLNEPAQSIPCARFFPVLLTIRQYLVLIYSVRVLISAAVGGTVMFLSSKLSRIATIAIGVFLLIIPMGLVALRF